MCDKLSVCLFQAEGGIRARTVTGVQTCALPIFNRASGSRRPIRGGLQIQPPLLRRVRNEWLVCLRLGAFCDQRSRTDGWIPHPQSFLIRRSEERRVGKECMYRRFSNNHKKNDRG